MKIAVIGAGLFGVTTAIKLAEAGHAVELYEKNSDILEAASGINQYRLHRGYHYPRSQDTIDSSLRSEPLFMKEYGEAIISEAEHYYCIAKERSFTSGDQFLAVCKKNGLEYELAELSDLVEEDQIDVAVRVKEALIDPSFLKKICKERIADSGVVLHCNYEATEDMFNEYDHVVLCAYAAQNALLASCGAYQRDYQFELCEKPLVRLPKQFLRKSIVIMDGPFMCIDPYAHTELHVMGNVVHAIHATNIGKFPIVPEVLRPLLNCGVVENPSITNFKKFVESGSQFIPLLKDAEHIGSMYTVRTVLPHKDATDTRPTLVEAVDNRITSVFSGKLSNCVEAAEQVVMRVGSLSTIQALA